VSEFFTFKHSERFQPPPPPSRYYGRKTLAKSSMFVCDYDSRPLVFCPRSVAHNLHRRHFSSSPLSSFGCLFLLLVVVGDRVLPAYSSLPLSKNWPTLISHSPFHFSIMVSILVPLLHDVALGIVFALPFFFGLGSECPTRTQSLHEIGIL